MSDQLLPDLTQLLVSHVASIFYLQEFAAKKAKYQIPTAMKKDICEASKAVEKIIGQLGKIIVEKAASPAHVKDVLTRGVSEYKVFAALVSKVNALLK